MKKVWTVPTESGELLVSADYTLFLGKLTVTIGEDIFPLPSKFLTVFFGRRESLMIDDKLAILAIRPFGKADLIVGGKPL